LQVGEAEVVGEEEAVVEEEEAVGVGVAIPLVAHRIPAPWRPWPRRYMEVGEYPRPIYTQPHQAARTELVAFCEQLSREPQAPSRSC